MSLKFPFKSLQLQRPLWINPPGHARLKRNIWADRLTSNADIIFNLQLGRIEVLRDLRHIMNMDRPDHRNTDQLKGRGVEKRSRCK